MTGERYVSPVEGNEGDINGDPIPGAKLYFFDNNTTNPKATYADVDLTQANANPVEADGAGRFTQDIFLQNSSYRVRFTDANDVIIWDKNDVNNIVQNTTTGVLPFPGMVICFFGTQDQLDVWLSNGWFVCDGNNGTPNLDEQFVRGTSNIAGVGLTGGQDQITPTGTVQGHVLTISEMPSHDHSCGNANLAGGGGSNVHVNGGGSGLVLPTGGGQSHDHGLVMDQQTNLPSYTQLIFLYFGGT